MTDTATLAAAADADLQYERAKALVITHHKTSTSWLQRQMRIGYNSAAGLIERMEAEGIVGAPDHAGRRLIEAEFSADQLSQLMKNLGKVSRIIPATEEQISIPVDLPESHRTVDDRLRLLIERVERLEDEKKGIADDIRDVFAEAKALGYDTKIMRQIIRLRKLSPDDRAEMEALLDTYKCALGLAT